MRKIRPKLEPKIKMASGGIRNHSNKPLLNHFRGDLSGIFIMPPHAEENNKFVQTEVLNERF